MRGALAGGLVVVMFVGCAYMFLLALDRAAVQSYYDNLQDNQFVEWAQ